MHQDHRYHQTVLAIRESLTDAAERYLPGGAYQDFYLWALSPRNPRQDDFCRLIALNQLAHLTTAILSELDEYDDWDPLLKSALPVNIYQVFEVVSDNLALGLAPLSPRKPNACRKLLLNFDKAIVDDLLNPMETPAAELLAPLQDQSRAISGFTQSLSPERHAAIARNYAIATGQCQPGDVEHNVWHGLVANMESGRAVLTAIAGSPMEGMVREYTIDRYQAVDRLLTTDHLPLLERAALGTQSILVVPTLGYFIAVLDDMTGPDQGLHSAINDGSMLELLSTAALLVRLQNDLGTQLLRLSPEEQAGLIARLPHQVGVRRKDETTVSLLSKAARQLPVLNRFHKDLDNGEFNVCLHDAYFIPEISEGLTALTESIAYFSALYRQYESRFSRELARMSMRVRDKRIITLVQRFVSFHEEMYTADYAQGAGDYAV